MREEDKEKMAEIIAARIRRPTEGRRTTARLIVHWPLSRWKEIVDRALAERVISDADRVPAVMRIEGSMLTVGRHYGGMKYNNEHFTYFEPEIDGHAPNPDGTPYVAWLMVRDDFLEWVIKQASAETAEGQMEKKES